MRMMHKDFISVLPYRQLDAQWNTCCKIVKKFYKKGDVDNAIVKRFKNYNIGHLLLYATLVFDELSKHRNNLNFNKFFKWYSKLNLSREEIPSYENLFQDWHNERYAKQTYYILQEKFDNDLLSKEEWIPIEEKFKNRFS